MVDNIKGKNDLIPAIMGICAEALFVDYKEKLLELIEKVGKLEKNLGLYRFEVEFATPTRYFVNFCQEYKRELKNNPDIAIPKFMEVIQNVEKTVDLYLTMLQDISGKNDFDLLLEAPDDVYCTLDTHGTLMISQKAYYCKDCKIEGKEMICEGCTITCHKGHAIEPRGTLKGFCDCRFITTSCKLQRCCSAKVTERSFIDQNRFICETCGMKERGSEMLCHFCILQCHKGHKVKKLSRAHGFCDCAYIFDFCKSSHEVRKDNSNAVLNTLKNSFISVFNKKK